MIQYKFKIPDFSVNYRQLWHHLFLKWQTNEISRLVHITRWEYLIYVNRYQYTRR